MLRRRPGGIGPDRPGVLVAMDRPRIDAVDLVVPLGALYRGTTLDPAG